LKELENTLSIMPNPGDGLFIIDKLPIETEKIIIVDISGKVIRRWDRNEIKNSESMQVDLRHLSSGLYTLNLYIKGQSISRKLIKN
jgi:hypothetical protein